MPVDAASRAAADSPQPITQIVEHRVGDGQRERSNGHALTLGPASDSRGAAQALLRARR